MISLLKWTLPILLLSACGQGESDKDESTAVSSESLAAVQAPHSAVIDACKDVEVPPSEPYRLCRTLSDGSIYVVKLKGSTYILDPETCTLISDDDGMRQSMLQMGFQPCDEITPSH